MSTQVMAGRAALAACPVPQGTPARIALLGCGNVGTEVVRLLDEDARAPMRVDRALVRRPRACRSGLDVRFTTSPESAFETGPDLVIELLGGCEPARTLVLDALTRGLPVVTANKSLLARHGRELREAARRSQVPLQYEAAVIAGVPFLGTFARRPLAARARGLVGIVNGTSNFVLTESARLGIDVLDALPEAQRRGYAEPDPLSDVDGTDALEKLVVLLQHFAAVDARVDAIETDGIVRISGSHQALAGELGGVIKPVIAADWTNGLDAFAAPAFVPVRHPLHNVQGVENALLIETPHGRLLFQGPGAGPRVTAATVLDDVHEVVTGVAAAPSSDLSAVAVRAPLTGSLIILDAPQLPPPLELADYFASRDIYIQRMTERRSRSGREQQAFLTWPAERSAVLRALAALERAAALTSFAIRALEAKP